MEVTHRTVSVPLAQPFTISRETSVRRAARADRVLRANGVDGLRRGDPQEHYGESVDVGRRRSSTEAGGLLGDDPFALEEIGARLAEMPGEAPLRRPSTRRCTTSAGSSRSARLAAARPAARGAADVVDDLARRSRRHGPSRRARRRRRFRRLKLKLGGRDGLDVERVRAVRGATDLPLMVDVNECWTLDEALELDRRARRARRRVRRAAAPRRRPGRAGAEAPPASDLRRRGLPHARRRRRLRRARPRGQHQAREVGRDPRGRPDGRTRPGRSASASCSAA